MPEITPEYPVGKRSMEMILVEMLSEKRSWHDRQQIERALHSVRKHANDLEAEKRVVDPRNNESQGSTGTRA